nr:hypothetical protein [Tanacetum cinerariifolium]
FNNEDLEQIDTGDLEEIDLKWQVGNRNRYAPTRSAPMDTSTINALVVQDRIGGYDWSFQTEEELTNFALMAYTAQGSSSSSSSDSENEAVYEEDIAFLKYDVQVKDISIKEIKNQLENALKEKDDLKIKIEKFETSYKNLIKLINSQISSIDKTGLGYDGQMNESNLNDIHVNESEVLNNVFDSRESDGDDNHVNDRFKKGKGYHVVPPPYTGNYMPPRADLSFAGLDDSVFKSKVSETITSVPKIDTNASKTSKDSLEKPKIVRNTTVENENKAKKPRKFNQSLRGPKSSEDEVADDAGKKSTKVLRKENGVQDPEKEGDKNDQEKDLRDYEEALRKQCEQEFKRLFS